MVNVVHRVCKHEGCSKRPSFGMAGRKTAEFCSHHASEGMVNIRNRRCRNKGCSKRPSFGMAGRKKAEFCTQHATERRANIRSKICMHGGCTELLSLGIARSESSYFCSKHALDGIHVKRETACENVRRTRQTYDDSYSLINSEENRSRASKRRRMHPSKEDLGTIHDDHVKVEMKPEYS